MNLIQIELIDSCMMYYHKIIVYMVLYWLCTLRMITLKRIILTSFDAILTSPLVISERYQDTLYHFLSIP